MVAKIVFSRTRWCSTRAAFQLIGSSDDAGVTGRRGPDHLRERLGEHERLALQHAVEQPDRGQDQLQQPSQVRRRRGGCGYARPAPLYGDITHTRLPCSYRTRYPAGNAGKLAGIPLGTAGTIR